jgi:uncharacterized protein with HEPN domain
MKRWLESYIGPNVSIAGHRREFYRICAENKLIDDVSKWFEFHEARNRSSHIYNRIVAAEVFAVAREFLPYAQDCLKQLEKFT